MLGMSFSWKRLLGISAAKGRLSKAIGVPLTQSGRERKIGRMLAGRGFGWLAFLPGGFGGAPSYRRTSRLTVLSVLLSIAAVVAAKYWMGAYVWKIWMAAGIAAGLGLLLSAGRRGGRFMAFASVALCVAAGAYAWSHDSASAAASQPAASQPFVLPEI
jgi:hypothetical protein